MVRPRPITLLVAILLAVGGVACSSGDGTGTVPAAARRQAVEKLRSYGLTKDQADCVVGRLGTDTVVEATDLDALGASEPYQTAARACVRKGS